MIRPAVPRIAPRRVKAVLGGSPKFARFNRLNNSNRNWMLNCSETLARRVFFRREKSTVDKPGPIMVFRARFPKNPLGAGVKDDVS